MKHPAVFGILPALAAGVAVAEQPVTPKIPVTDTYHGETVTDYYRWLEEGSSDEVRNWSDAQNAHARSILDNLPSVDAIRDRVTEILTAKTVSPGLFELMSVLGKDTCLRRVKHFLTV